MGDIAVRQQAPIQRVEVTGFQSLASVRLELGQLTAVVGPSNSGKSALVRALRVWALGGRGTWYVRHGVRSAAVTVVFADGASVRTVRGAQNAYRVRLPEAAEETYTKLSGVVPEAVAALLALTELSFAGQFDRPYLVTEAGAAVARTLAGLTALDRIHGAGREAVRRKRTVAADLRAQQDVLSGLRARAAGFSGLPAQRAAVEAAEGALADAEATALRAARLRVLTETARVAESVLARVVELPPVPDLTAAEARVGRYLRLRAAASDLAAAQRAVTAAQAASVAAVQAERTGAAAVASALVAAGACPLCGRPTDGHRGDHG